ncbi:kunitz-type protease inhibitor 2 [Dromiciops gliroides]|uniref:kunitz-type protease inhibitor 2 n=1 Tax=Dromiciops gliroides TaxID=33562 RepID=UPI001CC6F05E|nr:kunitz-type protease inhibitor 2 [Dromiciops gliroides]
MGQRRLRGPPHFPALLALLGALLLAGAAWGFDDHPDSTSDNEEPVDRRGDGAPPKDDSEVFPENDFNFEDYCAAKAVTGPCRAAFPRWYFDPKNKTCAHFIYGGCRGNKNSYLTQEECMTKCSGKQTHKSSHPVMLHSTKAVAFGGVSAVIAALLLGAMVVILIKISRKQQASAFNTMWSPIDDKEYLVKSTNIL